MELGLKGKNVIVTGGGSNIGRAIVHAFAEEGSNVVIAELVPAQGERVAAEVAALGGGGRVLVVPTDVTDNGQVEAMVGQAVAELGRAIVWRNPPRSPFAKGLPLNKGEI